MSLTPLLLMSQFDSVTFGEETEESLPIVYLKYHPHEAVVVTDPAHLGWADVDDAVKDYAGVKGILQRLIAGEEVPLRGSQFSAFSKWNHARGSKTMKSFRDSVIKYTGYNQKHGLVGDGTKTLGPEPVYRS